MRTIASKKSKSFGLRFPPALRTDLDEATAASGLNTPEALRLAAEAMLATYKKHGRIPRDMEIRQAQVTPVIGAINEDTILADLATRYAGYLAPRMSHALGALYVDQPRALHDLLTALLEHLARGLPLDDIVICPREEWRPPPFQQVAEPPGAYPTKKLLKPPEKPSPKEGGTGPVALVSDLPA